MKPAAFDYQAPTTIADALALLERHGSDARLLAGGQTLLPMMNFRLVAPEVVIDLGRIPDLAFIEADGNHVRIGAMTRQRALEFSPVVARHLPLLHEAVKMVGHLPTRSRGTIGGSLANADSSAEIPMVLQVLEGEMLVRGPHGERTIPAAEFAVDAMTTSLAEHEMLVAIRVPVMPQGTRFAIEEFSRRRGDFAIAAVAVTVLMQDGVCRSARLATAGVSPVSRRLREAEQWLEGSTLDADAIGRAAQAASETVDPSADRNGSEQYRRHLTKALTKRALQRAAAPRQSA
ncbi:xanthine dehydrogenase family protein subunit M [Rhodopseudomonas sp. HC1]|uniref:FAD binding domain-containing protein n=1 Tax=Rhodopseudomonas infernalis TaxID=2897386 RepID=UPI001EE96D20|nr:xanthine dehydrogenase family protein subunit M [Rhodopseudomonas infernalis]MCG6205253.1 xanthine dehydrogenase family protein subunit M [Rhodopseudomonas infernalis]